MQTGLAHFLPLAMVCPLSSAFPGPNWRGERQLAAKHSMKSGSPAQRISQRRTLAVGQVNPVRPERRPGSQAATLSYPASALVVILGDVTVTVLESIPTAASQGTSPRQKRVLLLKPRGFCAGVVRAIDVVKIALETFGRPIYVRREIVHNRYVVNELAEKGAIFVHEIEEVPDGQRVIYSAHGVSPAVREASKRRHLKVIDATCPLVTKVHIEAVKFARQGYSLVLIGHRDHDEIEGTLGEAPEVTHVVSNVAEVEVLQVPDPNRVAYLTQTTLSLDEARDIIHALKLKFPNIAGPHSQDICYATENRQVAVRNVAHNAELVLVVGSTNSSNSNRLVEVSRNLGTIGYLIDNSQAIDPKWLAGVETVAVTAGASAPEVLVEDVVNYLRQNGFDSVEEVEVMPENVRFGLPAEIVQVIGSAAGDEPVPAR